MQAGGSEGLSAQFMKKLIILLSLILIPVIAYFIYASTSDESPGTEIKISFVAAQQHSGKDLNCNCLLNDYDWLILHSKDLQMNWQIEGYVIPTVDFTKNYLIMSRYKIIKLFRKKGCDECLGVPDGEAIFDKDNSDSDYYYFYIMPRIMLSQGVG
jgi:hypothetical protein